MDGKKAAQGVQFDEPSRGAAIQRSLPEVHCEEVREAFFLWMY